MNLLGWFFTTSSFYSYSKWLDPSCLDSFWFGDQNVLNCILAVPPGREKVKLLLCFTSTLWGNPDMQRCFFAGDDCAYQKLQSCVYELLDVGEYEDLKMIQENIDDLFQCCVCWGSNSTNCDSLRREDSYPKRKIFVHPIILK